VKDGMCAAGIISRLRLLFKKVAPEWELVDVDEVIREMIVLRLRLLPCVLVHAHDDSE
jgi:hypothetical protein